MSGVAAEERLERCENGCVEIIARAREFRRFINLPERDPIPRVRQLENAVYNTMAWDAHLAAEAIGLSDRESYAILRKPIDFSGLVD